MDIKVREKGDTSIVEIAGRIDTVTSPDAEVAINKVLDGGCSKIIINLGETEYMSSSGLRVLLVTAKKISAISGKLKICQPNPVVKEILDISGFSTILDVHETESSALSAIQL